MYDVLIVGAGAAGLLAAASAAQRGARTCLLEKNRQAGVKILMSGGTRCNITHHTDQQGIAAGFAAFEKRQGQFLRSPLAALPPEEVVARVEALGVATKVEDTGKVFPVSNRAIDVRDALLRLAVSSGAEIRYNCGVTEVLPTSERVEVTSESGTVTGGTVIITTGGQSYPGCGTTGDGYAWARQLGHTIVNPVPALTPITTDADWVRELRGVTIADAGVALVNHDSRRGTGEYGAKQFLASRRSSLLLTHFGFSGPAALDLSRFITCRPQRTPLCVVCDFLPAVTDEELLQDLTSEFRAAGSRQVGNLLPVPIVRRLWEAVLRQADVPADARCAELSKKQIRRLAAHLKGSVVPVSGTLGFKKAEVTAGGVPLKEVDSKTMQSKRAERVYFAGEILDLDGPIGGFNFQAAFSTGWLAGQHAASRRES
ncbi:MAG: NAD(P)/FAD-dependent oxidoreductase [Planctomycetaceae bacterium]|nr:NAD(P)/FAD-dependent oxidoreductase [Planctomycetaceae bacterium]